MIDINTLEEMFEGDTEIIDELFSLYLSENETITSKILDEYNSENFNALYNTAHSLSGSLGNLCEINIISHIKEIEYLTKVNELPKIDTIDNAIQGLTDIAEQMNNYLAKSQH